jgi:replicative DNA helicase
MTNENLELVPPQALESEQAVLGSMLYEIDAVMQAERLLDETDFYREAHRTIFRGCLDLFRKREPVDFQTIGGWLKARGELDAVGGTLYLTTLAANSLGAYSVPHHARVVRTRALQRELIHKANDVITAAYRNDANVEETIAFAQETLFAVGQRTDAKGARLMRDFARDAFIAKEDAIEAGVEDGFKTGWRSVNNMIRFIRPGQVVIVAARPKVGKTVYALNWAHALACQGIPGLVFSLEMDGTDLTMRQLLSYMPVTRLELDDLEYCRENKERVLTHFGRAVEGVWDLPLYLDDRPALSVAQMAAEIRRKQRESQRTFGKPLAYIMVDFLQLARPSGKHNSRAEAMGALAYELKNLAKGAGVAIIGTAQLNRDVEDRSPRRPRIDDLGESGKWEQAADRVFYLYRPGAYGPEEVAAAGHKRSDVTEVGLMASRHEPTGMTLLRFDGERQAFATYTREEWQSMGYCDGEGE